MPGGFWIEAPHEGIGVSDVTVSRYVSGCRDEECGVWVEGEGGLLAAGPNRTRERRFVHNMIHTVPASETEECVRGLNCVPSHFLRR